MFWQNINNMAELLQKFKTHIPTMHIFSRLVYTKGELKFEIPHACKQRLPSFHLTFSCKSGI